MVGRDRLALILLSASLVAVALVVGLVGHRESELRSERARAQGVGLARSLARVPVEDLAPTGRKVGPLELLKTGQGNPDFAYAAVVDPTGLLLSDVTRSGFVIPRVAMVDDPASWVGARTLAEPSTGVAVREFSAPILRGGTLVGHVRIGFLVPGFRGVFEDTAFLALISLCVLLLMPLSYFLLRREIAPIEDLSQQMGVHVARDDAGPIKIEAAGSLREFIGALNQFVELSAGRADSLRGEKTQLLATAKVLEHEKARFASLLDAIPLGAVELDESGHATYANRQLARIVDVDLPDCVGRHPKSWGALPEITHALTMAANNRRTTHEASIGADPPRRIEVSSLPISGQDSERTLILVRDVSDQALALEANADFLAHVAHELKSPLGVLAMYSESLLGDRGANELHRVEACNTMRDEIERLGILIDTLLSIARIESGRVSLQPTRVRLGEFLSDILETNSRGHEDALGFSLDAPPEVSPAFLDKELFRIAINNLLTNAVKYNQPNGSVTLRVEDEPDSLRISIADTGIGIEESELSGIFDKFRRSEDDVAQKRGGHGLGLTLAREIVRLHGGDISVTSVPGEGSTFTAIFAKSSALFRSVDAV